MTDQAEVCPDCGNTGIVRVLVNLDHGPMEDWYNEQPCPTCNAPRGIGDPSMSESEQDRQDQCRKFYYATEKNYQAGLIDEYGLPIRETAGDDMRFSPEWNKENELTIEQVRARFKHYGIAPMFAKKTEQKP